METKLVLLALIALSTQGCGEAVPETELMSAQSQCAGLTWAGEWQGQTFPSDALKLNSDCTGTSSRCESAFTYTLVRGDGTIEVVFSTTNGIGGCAPSTGAYNCAINVEHVDTLGELTIDCGQGALVWER